MQKIMGGEFSIDNNLLFGAVPSGKNIVYSSGRNALSAILYSERRLGTGTILVPDFLCDSITRTIKDAGWKYRFYNINKNMQFDAENMFNGENVDAVLVINYFGMLKLGEIIKNIKKSVPHIVVIEDDVQAFFEYKNSQADYSFTSLRKWFPCPDGAFINTKWNLKDVFLGKGRWSQYKLAGNLLKNYAGEIDDSISLELLQKGEELIDVEYQTACSNASKVIFSNINLEEVASRRMENARFLHENLVKLGVKHIYQAGTVPLFVPIFSEKRNALRKNLFKNNIFAPVHWTKVSDELNGTNDIYTTELSLICDQRYGIEDMQRQLGVIEQFLYGEGM